MSPPFADTNPLDANALGVIEAECWHLLERACSDRDLPWRLPVLATVLSDHCRQRTVVLRKAETDSKCIYFHTDARSPKIDQLTQNPTASLLFYDPSLQTQLQLTGSTTIHRQDDIAEELWQQESPLSLRSFLATLPPGSPVTEEEMRSQEAALPSTPTRSEVQPGRNNFAVIRCQVQTMEWLMLRREGHLRALYQYDEPDVVRKQWLTP